MQSSPRTWCRSSAFASSVTALVPQAGTSSRTPSRSRAWRCAEVASIGLQKCRHTFASLMIAAGVNAKALATFMGHASITITLDRYGHLFPGSEDEAAALLDGYLARATSAVRQAAVKA